MNNISTPCRKQDKNYNMLAYLWFCQKKLDGAYHYDIKLSTQLLPDSKNKVDVLKLSKGINDQKNRDPTTFDR